MLKNNISPLKVLSILISSLIAVFIILEFGSYGYVFYKNLRKQAKAGPPHASQIRHRAHDLGYFGLCQKKPNHKRYF